MKPFSQVCRKHKVPSADALPSLIARLLYSNLLATAESITCDILVSLRSDLPQKQVESIIGNFIDVSKVKSLRPELDDSVSIWNHACGVQEATHAHRAKVSPSGEPCTNVAIFKLIPDLTATLKSILGNSRGGSFEVSYVVNFRRTRKFDGRAAALQTGSAMLIRCAYAADRPLVIRIIATHESAGFGFRWQGGNCS
jgi:hypothetical protein